MSHTANNQRLNKLLTPERNHYYYGKLLDERNLQMEQDYFNRKRWLLNRLGLGEGVLCGLQATASKDGKQLCISPGVAVDALGREIIVPEPWCFDPWQITDECGHVKETLSRTELHEKITICLAYNECYADYAPVLVTDCNEQEQCAPGTTRESFCMLVSEGTPDPVEVDSKLCDELNAPADTSSERRQNVCGVTLRACSTPSQSTCVILAKVKLTENGTIDNNVDNCGNRTMVYSNAMLFEMILCLAERIEECCGGKTPKAGLSLNAKLSPAVYSNVDEVIDYTFVVTNDGDVALNNVAIEFADPSLTLSCDSADPVKLNPGGTLTCTASRKAVQDDIDAGKIVYEVKAKGTDPNGIEVESRPASVTALAQQNPSLLLTKSANPTTFQHKGEVINYEVVVINDGNVTLSHVRISDATIDLICTQTDALAPNGKLTCTGSYTITEDDLNAGFVKNTANGSGSSPQNEQISVTAEATVKRKTFKIEVVSLMGYKSGQAGERVIARLDSQTGVTRYSLSRQTDGRISAIEISFNDDVDPASVTVAPKNLNPRQNPVNDFSVVVQSHSGTYVTGTISKPLLNPRIVRFVPDDSSPLTDPEVYTVTLYGDEDNRSGKHPYIMDTNKVQLDGESTQLPSGNDTAGGNFRFEFEVTT